VPSATGSPPAPSQSLGSGLIGAAIAVSAWGSSGVIVKAVDLDPVAISFYRFTVYSLAIYVVLRIRGTTPTLSVLKHSAAGGISLGVDVVLFFTAVKTTTVVTPTRSRCCACSHRRGDHRSYPVVREPRMEWSGRSCGAWRTVCVDGLPRHVEAIGRCVDLDRVHTWNRVLDRSRCTPSRFCRRSRHVAPKSETVGGPTYSRHHRWTARPFAHELVAHSNTAMAWFDTHIANPNRVIADRLGRFGRVADFASACRHGICRHCTLSHRDLSTKSHTGSTTDCSANLTSNGFTRR